MNSRARINNGAGRFVSMDELQQHIGMGRSSAAKVAQDAKAVIKYGRRVVYDLSKIDAYMESLAG